MDFKIFADLQTVDGAAIAQMHKAMNNSFVVKGALMPDTHKGYALPIGAVVETKDVVVPSWVGYDIGCGMSCTITNIKSDSISLNELNQLKLNILKIVPVGNNRHKDNTYSFGLVSSLTSLGKEVFTKRSKNQLGTLGGGNHFIELGSNQEGYLCITIHSGSRGFGHGIATEYMRLAAELHGVTKGNLEGNYGITIESPLFNQYLNDAIIAQEYALQNRKLMTNNILNELAKLLKNTKINSTVFINKNHNHVYQDINSGNMVHRKGATHAEKDMLGVIPGNMRDGCFIVKGLGNPDWCNSSSHGAGRVLSRSQAKAQLSLEAMQKQMEGIVGCISEATLDEAPDAYKNIFEVMELQKDSVEIIDYVKPLLNIKG